MFKPKPWLPHILQEAIKKHPPDPSYLGYDAVVKLCTDSRMKIAWQELESRACISKRKLHPLEYYIGTAESSAASIKRRGNGVCNYERAASSAKNAAAHIEKALAELKYLSDAIYKDTTPVSSDADLSMNLFFLSKFTLEGTLQISQPCQGNTNCVNKMFAFIGIARDLQEFLPEIEKKLNACSGHQRVRGSTYQGPRILAESLLRCTRDCFTTLCLNAVAVTVQVLTEHTYDNEALKKIAARTSPIKQGTESPDIF